MFVTLHDEDSVCCKPDIFLCVVVTILDKGTGIIHHKCIFVYVLFSCRSFYSLDLCFLFLFISLGNVVIMIFS